MSFTLWRIKFAKLNQNTNTMKKLALIVGLMIPALNSIASKAYPPMVVEGRTWHYDAPVAALCQQAFRFRIGHAENIDGETWYPVLQIWKFRASE